MTVTTLKPELLTEKGMTGTIQIDLSQAPETVGPLVDLQKARNMHNKGYQYGKDVNDWFSAALQKDVALVRASPRDVKKANSYRRIQEKPGNLVKGF